MRSLNFEFLRPKRAALADLAGFAEAYAWSDPAGALVKQRTFIEHAVLAIYEHYRLPLPYSDKLHDLLMAEPLRQSVPDTVLTHLHLVRQAGNDAAHPRRPIPPQLALECLPLLFNIARWLHLKIDRGDRAVVPDYAPPPPPSESAAFRWLSLPLRVDGGPTPLVDENRVHTRVGRASSPCARSGRCDWMGSQFFSTKECAEYLGTGRDPVRIWGPSQRAPRCRTESFVQFEKIAAAQCSDEGDPR